MSKFVNPIELKKQIESKIQAVQPDLSELTAKVQAVNKFTMRLFNKMHKTLFLVMILLCALLSIPMLCLNYMSSLGTTQNPSAIPKPTNTIALMLLNLSTFSTIYYSDSNPYIQLFILMALLIFSLALLLLAQTWLKYIPKVYKSKVARIQNYSLQITVRDKIRKKEINQVIEYLDNYLTQCLKSKIILLQSTENKTLEERSLLNLLKQISKKPTAIQDALLIPFRTNDLPAELLDIRDEASNIIIAVFTYPEVAQVTFEWWQVKENADTINTHILDVILAPSTRNLLFDKFQNKASYKNKVVSAQKYIVGAIVWQISFFLLFCGIQYISSMPSFIFSTDFVKANQFMFKVGMLGAQAVLMFLHVKLYHESFLPGCLLKSLPSVFTFEEEANRGVKWSFWLLMWDIFLIPFCAHFLVDLVSLDFTSEYLKFIFQDTLFGQYGISNLFVGYCVLKHVIGPISKALFRLVRKCVSKCRRCTACSPQQEQPIAYASVFIQFAILFCWSIVCSPVISCLLLLGLLFKLEEFCNLKEFKPTCLIALCQYLEKLTHLLKYFLIVCGGIFMNCLLNSYLLAIKPDIVNPLIIASIVSLFLLIACIFLDKIEPNALQKPVYFFFQSLPSKIQSKLLYDPEQSAKHEKPRLVPLLDQTTKAIVQKVYPNQQIFFTYNEELRENKALFNSQIPQLNPQESAKKINDQMNTMSRSLQESLKNRLLAKPPNPFEIAQTTKEQDGEYSGIIYEDKVMMGPSKLKNVFIPLLELPENQRRSQTQPQILNKVIENRYITQLQRVNTTTPPKHKQKPKRTYEAYQMAHNQTNSWGDLLIYGGQIEGEENTKQAKAVNAKSNKMTQERTKKQPQVADELLQRKVKFTDLFDSDEQSIKNLVKKKIKQSIPKLK